jgi:hypothetical protein
MEIGMTKAYRAVVVGLLSAWAFHAVAGATHSACHYKRGQVVSPASGVKAKIPPISPASSSSANNNNNQQCDPDSDNCGNAYSLRKGRQH